MNSITRETKAGKITRTILVSLNYACQAVAVVMETLERKTTSKTTTDYYRLRRIESQIGGVAVEVEKRGDAELRHVLLNEPGKGHSCSCAWGTYKPNAKPCRHVEMALAAMQRGIV